MEMNNNSMIPTNGLKSMSDEGIRASYILMKAFCEYLRKQ